MDDHLKNMIVVGDRVLIRPARGEERTGVGLYLPPTAVDQKAVQGGRILATGPGTPLAAPNSLGEEPWKIEADSGKRFIPMEARAGDYALFFRKAAVEISFKDEKYLVVPLAAILVLVRPDDPLKELVAEPERESD
jgi:chaperonin GroES